MIEVVKFKKAHFQSLDEDQQTAYLNVYFTEAHQEALEAQPYSYTLFSGEKIVACAGLIEYWPGRGEAWAMFNQNCRREFIHAHTVFKRFIKACPVRRIEAAVDVGFKNGHRWMKTLGFTLEAPVMEAYRPDGGDCALYARVK